MVYLHKRETVHTNEHCATYSLQTNGMRLRNTQKLNRHTEYIVSLKLLAIYQLDTPETVNIVPQRFRLCNY